MYTQCIYTYIYTYILSIYKHMANICQVRQMVVSDDNPHKYFLPLQVRTTCE